VHAQFTDLLRRLAEIHDVEKAAAVLSWDEETKMPPRGAEARAEQRATLHRIAHDLNVAPALGELLEELRPFEQEHDEDSFEASIVRVARRDYEKAVRIPSDLRAEMTRAGSLGYQAWLRARAGGLRDHAAASRAQPRAAPPVRRVLRADRRPVRRRPRRLRARHEDGGGRRDLRRAEGGAAAVDRLGRRVRSRRRLVPARPLPPRCAAALLAVGARAVGDGPCLVAARQDRPSVRDLVRDQRHPPDDELPRGLAARDPLVPARVRAR